MNENKELYSIVSPSEALNRGNLFDYYFWPYKYVANIKPMNERDELMQKIQMYAFAAHELNLYLDDELIAAAKEKRSCIYKRYKRESFLQVILQQIGWKYNILTPAGKLLVKQEKIFVRLRDAVIDKLVDVLDGSSQEKQDMKKLIFELYPDEVLNED